jgi:DNA replication and repair protein RecF
MAVTRLEIENLRCIKAACLDLSPDRNLIFGANGAGKTSVLEAAFVLGRGHSFRVRDNRRLVRDGEAGFIVRCQREGEGAGRRLGVAYERGTLDVRLDGQRGTRATQLAQALPVEVIDPSSHRIIDGGPGERRRFMDWGLFHVEQGYMPRWRDFRRVLVQRNEALRRDVSEAELMAWDEAFIAAAADLDAIRGAFVERWGETVSAIGERLLGAAVALEYRDGSGRHRNLEAALGAGRAQERARGLTLNGPHRSDLIVRYGGGAARELASRGQQKLLAATFVLARLVDRIERHGNGGLLLVDDPVAELDDSALQRLIAELVRIPVQMIVTSIRAESMQALEAGRTFHVEHGVIQAL